jgi:hypothetical protein
MIEKFALLVALAAVASTALAWQPAQGPLLTRWAHDVTPDRTHPEYPRPQLVRKDWLNLNGLWDYAIAEKTAARPSEWQGQILVPFPVESALSGVMKQVGDQNRLWYRRTAKIPGSWKGRRVLLHFGAVDWESTVWVNGREVGSHRGGYDAFSIDITDALAPSGAQEIVVSVYDPTDANWQPRGKQVRRPEGIWYTPTTGIWQTAWLEPVADTWISPLRIVPDVDQGQVRVSALINGNTDGVEIEATALEGSKSVAKAKGSAGSPITLSIPSAKLWSPDSPFLYDLRLTVRRGGKVVDDVKSYFGMRKIALGKDSQGILRLMLNNKPLFQFGPLDQGFWPDGLYTAPTDAALRYDIEMTRKLGFNMARKHVKIEPERWYYWCDKLGLLVWQDMPSGDRYIGSRDADITRTPESGRNFETELKALIDGRYNHPSIVMWVPYNEGWGQWDTCRIVDLIRSWDPTRLVNNTSGWTDRGCGDVNDIHSYPGPSVPNLEAKRALVLGEFGGLGLPLKGHTWQNEKNWGYRSYKNSSDLTDAYVALIQRMRPMTGDQGLCAAVYTQTTDVEVEVNGLMTYDRALVKMDQAAITAANLSVYSPAPKRVSEGTTLVPPATPLVACDPYFSIWSQADKLTDTETTHWTGRPHRLSSLVRVDGKAYRVMGASPASVPALPQKSLTVLPTRTLYTFEGAGITLTLTFTTPALPDDLDQLARPVTYVNYEFKSTDRKSHDVAVYFDASGELTVNQPDQEVTWSSESVGDLAVSKIGSKDQQILAKRGDDLRIDWGYLYLAAPAGTVSARAFAPHSATAAGFAANGMRAVPLTSGEAPTAAGDVCVAMAIDAGKVGSQTVSRWLMLAYDDIYAIEYMHKKLRPYWRRTGWEAADLLKAAAKDFPSLQQRCAAFDAELVADMARIGGEKYAKLCALAYRQCFAAGKFVADDNGQPLQFCKENHSNGCIGTSDVFYPMAPQFLLFGPTLAKSFLVPFMQYAASERWKFPFAPHDLGTYPKANGQVYGDGERGVNNQMPVEESGNLLCLMGAIAQMEGNPGFASLYWQQLDTWAAYLKDKGFDPENQLCTDDFAGHLAHNVNLSAKAICGLGAFAKLCEMRGEKAKADEYFALARGFAQRWVKEADDGEKFRLAFDRPGTWSQKYNLIWDRILGLNLFPDSVLRKEMDFYRKMQNRYGLPLDNRETYTKLDWITWTATLTRNRADFEALIDPIFTFMNETPDRSPLTDWYQTKSGRKVGFTARPVIGGVFVQALYDKPLWAKFAQRDRTRAANWAPIPKPPKIVQVVPSAREEAATWRYTTQRPAEGWFKPEFDASSWKEGQAGFGEPSTPGTTVRTRWTSSDIWIRREFTLPEGKFDQLELNLHHDEDARVYINGVLAVSAGGYSTDYEPVAISPAAKATLKPGRNIIAISCHQTGGGQYIDAGLVHVVSE